MVGMKFDNRLTPARRTFTDRKMYENLANSLAYRQPYSVSNILTSPQYKDADIRHQHVSCSWAAVPELHYRSRSLSLAPQHNYSLDEQLGNDWQLDPQTVWC